MSQSPIPEDLQGRYIELTRWDKGPLNGMQMPWPCGLDDEAKLIERIAALEAQNRMLREALDIIANPGVEYPWAECARIARAALAATKPKQEENR